jgi:DNA-binding protein WhiA
MSFSSNCKAELCRDNLAKKSAALAEAYGVLLYCNTFSADCVKIVTESRDFAQRLPKLFRKAFGFSFDREPEAGETGKLCFLILSPDKLRKIFASFGLTPLSSVTLHVNFGVLEDEGDRLSFLRGAFLAGGSVTDPSKRYHLELTTSHYKVSRETRALLLDAGFTPKELTRGGSSILYFKQSDFIEDFLTAVGAPVCAMGVMEARVEKDLRNGVNRRVNCETANLTKVVDASIDQTAAIKKLRERGMLDKLPEKLRKTAELRLENPEATLLELAGLLDPPVSKSAMNHRMRKLIELSGQEE